MDEYVSIGSDVVIQYNLTTGANGILSVYINNTFLKNVSVGEEIIISDLKAGTYSLKVKYNSNGFYDDCEDEKTLYVTKLIADYYVDGNLIADNYVNININFNSDVVGFVNVSFGKWNNDDEWIGQYNFTSKLNNGVASITIPKLTGGRHDLIINYSGSDRYDSDCFYDSIDVEYKNSPIVLNIDDVNWGDSINIKPILPAVQLEILLY